MGFNVNNESSRSELMACWIFGLTFASLLALFWSPGAPEKRIWLFSCQMLHFVSQTVANLDYLMVGAGQVALQAVKPKQALQFPICHILTLRQSQCLNLKSWGCDSTIDCSYFSFSLWTTTSELILTQSDGVIDSKAAENFLHVSGVKETVSFDYHLERFWGSRLCNKYFWRNLGRVM